MLQQSSGSHTQLSHILYELQLFSLRPILFSHWVPVICFVRLSADLALLAALQSGGLTNDNVGAVGERGGVKMDSINHQCDVLHILGTNRKWKKKKYWLQIELILWGLNWIGSHTDSAVGWSHFLLWHYSVRGEWRSHDLAVRVWEQASIYICSKL